MCYSACEVPNVCSTVSVARGLAFVAAVCVLVAGSAFALDSELDRAERLLHAGQMQAAEAICRRFLKAEPRSSEGWRILGLALMEEGRHAEGLEALKQRTQVSPQDPHARDEYDEYLFLYKQDASVLPELRAAITELPSSISRRNRLARLLERLGKKRDAESILKASAKYAPNDEGALLDLGRFYRFNGRLDLAIALFRRAWDSNPSSENAPTELGWALDASGSATQAIDVYKEWTRRTPTNGMPFLFLGGALEKQGSHILAAETYSRGLDVEPNMMVMRIAYAMSLLHSGSREEAVEQLEFVLSRAKDRYNQSAARKALTRIRGATR